MIKYDINNLCKDIETVMLAKGHVIEIEDRDSTRRFQATFFTIIIDATTDKLAISVAIPTADIVNLCSVLEQDELEVISIVFAMVKVFNDNTSEPVRQLSGFRPLGRGRAFALWLSFIPYFLY